MKIHCIVIALVLVASYTSTTSAQKTGKVEVDGLSFAYMEEGSGLPVVLIHGSVSDYREWSKQMKALARHYRVIAYSRRYHWPNTVPGTEADGSRELQVNDLASIIRALKLAPVHLVGHSYGGAIALQLALRHPELVRTLVVAEPGVGGVLANTTETEAARKEGQAIQDMMKRAFASGDAERIVRTYAAQVAPGVFEKAKPEVRQMLLDNVLAFHLDFSSRRLPFTCDDARRITTPALVFAGERSTPGLQLIAKTLAGCLKEARFVRIPNATHWIPHDQPQKFNTALLAFLGQHGKAVGNELPRSNQESSSLGRVFR
jgi:pimeloyl-ACP methyl ester carboxylesterase